MKNKKWIGGALLIATIVIVSGIYFGLLNNQSNELVPFKNGYRTYMFKDAKLIGPMNPQEKIWITIGLKWKNENKLDSFLENVNDVKSPYYHKYMSYDVFKKNFSPDKKTYNEMVEWIKSNGVHVEYTYPLHNSITIYDTVKKISKLFGTNFGDFKNSNPRWKSRFFAATNPPKIPGRFVPYISTINGFDNATKYHLNYYHSSGGNDYLSGADVAKMYRIYELYNDTSDGSASSKHIFATGLRVATVLWEGDAAPFDPNAVENYYQHVIPKWIQNLGVMSTVHSHGMSGTHSPGSNTDGSVSAENELDLEMVGTLAPGVDAYCVYGPGSSQGSPTESNFPDNEYNYILNTLSSDTSKILVTVSNSWGDGDGAVSSTTMNDVKALNAMGVTVLASSGDDGDTDSPSEPSTATYDDYGFLAIGGTTPVPNGIDHTSLDDYATMGYNTYISNPRSSEVVWYDGSSTNSQGDHWGTQSGISSSYSEPSWQTNHIGNKGGRATADIAAMGNHTLVYLSKGDGTSSWSAIAGTSVACPVVAGMLAEIDAYIGVQYKISNHGLGFLAPTLYALGDDYYNNGKYSSSPPFFDVTSTPHGYHNSEQQYWAKTGWDFATGWGVINGWEFVHDIGFALSASSTSASINAGETATYTITVSFPYDWTTDVGHFEVSGLPSGSSASESPTYVHPSGNGATANSDLNIQTSSSTPSGTYTITLIAHTYNHTTGHWGNLTKKISLTLTINGGGGGNPPSAPLNLQATAGDGYVKLTWSPPSDNGGSSITNYKIYRGTSSGGESYLAQVGGSTTTYTDNSVTNGVTYYYYVTAVNSVGESDKSNEVSATPHAGATVPSAPQNLQATAGDGYVKLTWSPPSDNGGSSITNYKIYRGTSSGGESYLAQVGGSTTTYTDNSVTNGVTYYYYVTAVNSVGESDKSNEVSATPHSSTTNNILLVDDDGGSNYEQYFEQALNDAGFSYEVWDVNQKTYSPSYSDLSSYQIVIWNTGYEYQNTLTSSDQSNLMKYLDNGGRLYISSQDLLWDLSNGNDGTISNTFVNNYLGVKGVANDIGYTSVKGVNGDPITGNIGTISLKYPFHNYADEISLESNAGAIFTNPSSGNVIADRVDSGTYKVVFTAFSFEAVENQNANTGELLLKNIVNWLSEGSSNNNPTVPSAPQNLQATAGDGYVKLTWEPPATNGGSSIMNYKIYRGTSSGGESYLAEVSSSTLSYKDDGLTNGNTYYYYVTAINSVGEGSKSNEVSGTPQASGNNILLVDDDGGRSDEQYFEQALYDAGFSYDVWDVSQKGSPSYSDLSSYEVVIWTTGYAYENTLTSNDQSNLMEYLDNGGRLYISSQDLLWDISGGYDGTISNTFVNNYLGVDSVSNDVGYSSVEGIGGDPISGNMGTISLDYPFYNYADEIGLESNAHGVFINPSSGNVVADRVDSGTYKVVFTAFSFEAVENQDSSTGAALIGNIINWLSS